MVYIHFIVNPISGNGNHNIGKTELEKYFSKEKFKIEVDYSNHKKHAITLTKKAIENNPNCIVACGGDGTINEVASCLINTKIKLGIIPVGSGNGLASNLNIPKEIKKATEIIYNIFGETPAFVSINYFAIYIDAFRHYPGFADDNNHLFSTEIDKIKYILDNAVKRGEIRKDIDTSIMALNFFSIALGIVANLFRNTSPTSAIDILKSQMDEFYKILKID